MTLSSTQTCDVQAAARLCCYHLDPTKDARWQRLIERHANASVFHSVGWLQALKRTYNYEPVAFTTSPPTAELTNGLVFCRVDSWLTGRRLVSLPFSDHCEPLCDSRDDLNFLTRYLQSALDREGWKYFETRSAKIDASEVGGRSGCVPASLYYLHTIDLKPNLDSLFQSFDKDSVQRRIQRAENAGLIERRGITPKLLKEFYNLMVMTRRRHQVPPAPYGWFQNLLEQNDAAVEIRVAYQNANPVAGILTLRFRDIVYYKYGCSDVRFNKFGAMPWLLWNAISAAKSNGACEFDLGRTECDNTGLVTFKNHWAPRPKQLIYWRFPETAYSPAADGGWKVKVAKRAFSRMPGGLLAVAGRLMYRHIG